MNCEPNTNTALAVSSTQEVCEVCTLPVDPNKPHIFAVNDIMAEGPYHPDCYEKGMAEEGTSNEQFDFHFDNEAHFTWPPQDSEQHQAYRDFLYQLQERVESLPMSEEDSVIPEEIAELNRQEAEILAQLEQVQARRGGRLNRI